VELARARTGAPAVLLRRVASVRLRPAPRHRHRCGRDRRPSRRAREWDGELCRLRAGQRREPHDRDGGRLLRDAHAPRFDLGCARSGRRRGRLRRHGGAERHARAVGAVRPPGHPAHRRLLRLPRPARALTAARATGAHSDACASAGTDADADARPGPHAHPPAPAPARRRWPLCRRACRDAASGNCSRRAFPCPAARTATEARGSAAARAGAGRPAVARPRSAGPAAGLRAAARGTADGGRKAHGVPGAGRLACRSRRARPRRRDRVRRSQARPQAGERPARIMDGCAST
jgi:hypothetical protein